MLMSLNKILQNPSFEKLRNIRSSNCTIKPVKPGVHIFVLDVLVDMSVFPPHIGHQCQLSFHTTLPLPLADQYLSPTEV